MLTTVTIGGQLAQQHVYTAGELTQIVDGDGKQLVGLRWAAGAPGTVAALETADGDLGFEYDATRAECSDRPVVYFNKGSSASCSVDSDCGGGMLCGGKSGPGATGMCFRAARCLTVDASGGEGRVTAVRALGPQGESCSGACAAVTEYVWNPQTLDLAAQKDALGAYTSVKYDANGMPIKIVTADNDADASAGGARVLYLYYDPVYPGRLRELRRPSVMKGVPGQYCTESNSTGCARTLYQYDYATGKLTQQIELGYTLSADGEPIEYDYTTTRTYDARGRLTSLDGPLPNVEADGGTWDVITYSYWQQSDPRWDGFASLTSTYTSRWVAMQEYPLDFDFWGNVTAWRGTDGAITCQRYDGARNLLVASSRSSSLVDCAIDDPQNLTERHAYDSAALQSRRSAHLEVGHLRRARRAGARRRRGRPRQDNPGGRRRPARDRRDPRGQRHAVGQLVADDQRHRRPHQGHRSRRQGARDRGR